MTIFTNLPRPAHSRRKLARDMDTQCFAKKFYGRGNGTWRCQFEEGHPGTHKDALGREWQQRNKRELYR